MRTTLLCCPPPPPPYKSALSILISVCENYAAEHIMFNHVRWLVQLVSEKKMVHLGHAVSTADRDRCTMAAKNIFWKSFYMFIANFEQLYCCIKIKVFSRFCCSFYGSPLWHLNGAIMHSLCVDWRESLRSHCDVITALSNQSPIIFTFQNGFNIRFMSKYLSSSKCILKLISHCVIFNPMSAAGKKYRSLIDDNGECNNSVAQLRNEDIQVNLLKYSFNVKRVN